MKVALIAHTPDPEHVLAAAARLCYSSADIATVMESLTPEKTAEFVHKLAALGHESPIEHVSFTFGIEGVSRSLLAQITRHRIASYSVQSQRYVREKMFEYVVPPEIEKEPQAKKIFLEAMEEDQRHYEELTAILKEKHLKAMLADGMPEKAAASAAEKKAIEDGKEVGSVCQNPYGMGYATIVAGARASLGLESDKKIDSGFQWIDKNTIGLEEYARYLY